MANRQRMHNRALHDALAAFVEEAARQLAEEVSGGAEVPFELVASPPRGRDQASLYCYRPMTGAFVADRVGMLARLPSYAAASTQLASLPALPAYLRARGRALPAGEEPRVLADAAIQAFLGAVWGDRTDFGFEPDRVHAAYAELEDAAYGGVDLAEILAPIEGLVIESSEVALGGGLRLVRAETLRHAPDGLGAAPDDAVAILSLEADPAGEGAELEAAGQRLRRLQTALRLWDDCEPALAPTAWARTDSGPWSLVPLGGGLRRDVGDCLLPSEEEDPLRAFCSLVARRTPRGGELAWALRRFELGCERTATGEALTDWLLAARALLGDPGEAGPARVPERLAAICAEPEHRADLEARIHEAFALERAAMAGQIARAGGGAGGDPVDVLVAELGSYLRAVLRDVLCGHLDPGLRRVADEVLRDAVPDSPSVAA